MTTVHLLWEVDNQSWVRSVRVLKGVFASRDRAIEEIPEWAKTSSIALRDPGNTFGADGISYEVIEREVVA